MDIQKILTDFKNNKIDITETEKLLTRPPFEDIDFACIDHNRELRTGNAEIIYGESKTAEQIVEITTHLLNQGANKILISRADNNKYLKLKSFFNKSVYYENARSIIIYNNDYKIENEMLSEKKIPGTLLIVTAGTSDIPIAEETFVTAEYLGCNVKKLNDVGVSGIHRLLSKIDLLQSADVIIVIAGMEGALPSVVGGLVDVPVIAVPTSVGYGSAFGGLSALLGMLNSCASGLAVVNIDNGFGAAYLAKRILKGLKK